MDGWAEQMEAGLGTVPVAAEMGCSAQSCDLEACAAAVVRTECCTLWHMCSCTAPSADAKLPCPRLALRWLTVLLHAFERWLLQTPKD